MSFVDGRVIQQRMNAKDARMNKTANKLAKVRGKLSVKQTGHHKGDPDARHAEAIETRNHGASPTSAAERSNGMTSQNPTTHDPVRTENAFLPWQPIETAPKDKAVLTWRGAGLFSVAERIDHPGDCGKKNQREIWCCVDGCELVNVTHWMPLPDPPANIEQAPSHDRR